MKIKRRREKEYSTHTLIDVNYKPEDVMDYDNGKAPVSRKTQHAEQLEDLVEFQKHAGGRNDMMNTHNYNVFHAVRDYNPDAGKKAPERDGDLEEHTDGPAVTVYDPGETEDIEPADAFEEEESSGTSDAFDADDATEDLSADDADSEEASDRTGQDEASDTSSSSAIEEELARDYEPRPLLPGDVGYDDIMEQFTAAPTKPKYWFEEFGDYWSCSCGHLNKGEYCTNCGLTRDLLRTLFILHKPGEEPGEYEGMPVKYEEVIVPRGRLSSKAKLIIAISVIAILLACGAFFTYYYMIVPAMEKQAAEELKNTTEAVSTGVEECFSETDNFFLNSYISAGDASFKDKHYEAAIGYYAKAQQIENSSELKEKVLEAKYQYVKAKQADGGEKFEKYLAELMGAGYKDVQEIYDKYYAWHFNIVANLSAEDYANDISTASRADIVYFHVSASGGPPDGTISVYYEATWPSGAKQTDVIGSNWTDGSKGSARFGYTIPFMAQEGTLKFNIYDKASNEQLGSDSVEIKK